MNDPQIPSISGRAIIAFMRVFASSSEKALIRLLSASLILFFMHIYFSFIKNDYNYIGAYGALLTIFSIILSISHTALPTLNDDLTMPAKIQGGGWVLSAQVRGGFARKISEEEALKVNSDHVHSISKKYRLIALSYSLSIFGTLLWAYSGFFNE